MKEIGGYIELDTYTGAMLHEKAIALNCGRGALEYLCETKMIRKLYLPYFLCDSVPNLCKKTNIESGNRAWQSNVADLRGLRFAESSF